MLNPRLPCGALSRTSPPDRGLAALTIVMVLFLIMAMVAAYTNRNLIFEQRTSANSYRAERALAAAEAGVDWTLSVLNSGRLNTHCELDDAGTDDYRTRYLSADSEGRLSVRTGTPTSTMYSGCTNVDGALNCTCPTTSASTASLTSTIDPPGNAFRVNFFPPGGAIRPGAIGLMVQGCGTPGISGAVCVSSSGSPQVDGIARVAVTLGLVRALPAAPIAALVAAGPVNAAGVELNIANEDGQTGYTVYSGGSVTQGGTSHLTVPAGLGGNGVVENDASLNGRRLADIANGATANDDMFTATFGLDGPNYRRQQGVVRKTCATPCTAEQLAYMIKAFPGRAIWFDGDLSIGSVTTDPIGTVTRPALVIATGTLSVQADNPMVGLFYGSAVNWSAAGANVRGAVISATAFTSTATTTITYDADVLQTLVTSYGTFVRAPGSWTRRQF